MILKDERILCMCVIHDDLLLAGTKKGNIIVFDAQSHERLRTITGLGDSIIALKMHYSDAFYFVVAGLANGEVAIFDGKQFFDKGEFLFSFLCPLPIYYQQTDDVVLASVPFICSCYNNIVSTLEDLPFGIL